MFLQSKASNHLLSFFLMAIRPQRYWFFLLQWLTLGWALDHTMMPIIYGTFIDKLVNFSEDPATAWPAIQGILLMGLCFWIYIEINYRLSGCLKAKLFPETEARIRLYLFDAVKKHSYHYFVDHFAGDIANRISEMPKAITGALELFLFLLIPTVVAGFVGITVAWLWVGPKIALILAFYFFMHMGISLFSSKYMQVHSKYHAYKNNILNGQIIDSLTNHSLWRLFSRSSFEQWRLLPYQSDEVVANKKVLFCSEKIKFLLGLFSLIFPMILLHLFLIFEWMDSKITIGNLVTIFQLTWSVQLLAWIAGMELPHFFKFLGECQQALSLVEEPIEVQDLPGAKELKVSQGKIVFDNVTFCYHHAKPLFQNLNITIHPGEKLGLVGYSGSGKTTFVNLLLRLFDVNGGRILIDGEDIRSVTQKSLRENIGTISQEPALFHRTLKENIAYGNPEATDEQIMRAVALAGAHEFIQNLPNQYETLVGERGVKLSGGQRQRIAIARVVLKNAPILILDEATSALDSVTEREIQRSLELLMQHKTTIVIAHRLSTLLKMDRILVFDKGRIVEDGTHEALLQNKGLYTELWQSQIGGFLSDGVEQT